MSSVTIMLSQKKNELKNTLAPKCIHIHVHNMKTGVDIVCAVFLLSASATNVFFSCKNFSLIYTLELNISWLKINYFMIEKAQYYQNKICTTFDE